MSTSVYDIHPDMYRSHLARALVRLGPRLATRIRLPGALIIVLEVIVCMAELYTADDSKPFETRLDNLGKDSLMVVDDVEIDDSAIEDAERWVQRLKRHDGRLFIERTLGSAFRHKFEKAFQDDMRTVVPAIRKGLTELLPVAHAYDTCTVLLEGTDGESPTMLTVFVVAEKALAALVDREFQLNGGPLRPAETAVRAEADAIASRVSEESTTHAVHLIEGLGTPLIRKIRGAREVIGVSSDAASQAAHSIVEFIDRILRDVVTEDEVLTWIDEHMPERISELTV